MSDNSNTINKLDIIRQDFKDIRKVRQDNTNKLVYDSIKSNNYKEFYKNINKKEFNRTLIDLQLTEEQFFQKCIEDDAFCKLASRNISKMSSRQGTKDEMVQIQTCNLTAKKYGINIINLSAKAYRPTNDGRIISFDEQKKNKIPIDNCLKSFDGKIDGNLSGFISSKISFGEGGHQDNVFREQDNYAEWWSKYKNDTNELLVLLIDTDLQEQFDRLKDKYINLNNVFVFNHIEFQQYMIDKYYKEESK